MKAQEALDRLHRIVAGIDRDEVEHESGWWPTSHGAQFGAGRLAELEDLVRELAPS